jgi:hypothetical protein
VRHPILLAGLVASLAIAPSAGAEPFRAPAESALVRPDAHVGNPPAPVTAGQGPDAGSAMRALVAENAELSSMNAELRKLVTELEGNTARSTKELEKKLDELQYGTDVPSDPKRWTSGDAFWFVVAGLVGGIAVGRMGRRRGSD